MPSTAAKQLGNLSQLPNFMIDDKPGNVFYTQAQQESFKHKLRVLLSTYFTQFEFPMLEVPLL